jgi:hypothetical protein
MNGYLNYSKTEELVKDGNEPMGIILSAGKDEPLPEYGIVGI